MTWLLIALAVVVALVLYVRWIMGQDWGGG